MEKAIATSLPSMRVSRARVPTALWVIVATAATALLGAWASLDAADFYKTLDRPTWAPPAWVFGPVWTALYLLMLVAGTLALHPPLTRLVQQARGLFVAQLFANGLWSWLFFAWHNGFAAIVDVVVLLVLIALCLRSFFRIRRVAGILLVPYFLWVSFATALTIAVYANNRGIL